MNITSSPARDVAVKACLAEPQLGVMNCLNEIVYRHPDAISFAPGRPPQLLDVKAQLDGIREFVEADAAETGRPEIEAWQNFTQYGRTRGVITKAIAHHLERDEGICVSPDAIVVTVGAQEAMAVTLAGLFDSPDDVLLVTDPTYVGITGLARILNVTMVPVPSGESGLTAATLDRTIGEAGSIGRVKGIYGIPDFNNPLGTVIPLDERHAILEVCRRHDVLFLEDNPYGMFAYDRPRLPTLKALDRDARVLYIGSFSKTLFPALRLGYLVADQRTPLGDGCLASALSTVKSLLTVNTSAISQAIAASTLARSGGSLEPLVEPVRAYLRVNRDALLASLDQEFGDLRPMVSWNRPEGGFFAAMTLPFDFGIDELHRCAERHGVIVCPMNFFSLRQDRGREIRLSFSSVSPAQIQAGTARLGRFVRQECGARGLD